jgi:hypothetical protein
MIYVLSFVNVADHVPSRLESLPHVTMAPLLCGGWPEKRQHRCHSHGTRLIRPLIPSPVLLPYIQKSGGFPSVPQRTLSDSRMAVIPEFNEVRNQIPLRYEHEYAELDSFDSSTLSEDDSLPRSVDVEHFKPTKSLRRTPKAHEKLHV